MSLIDLRGSYLSMLSGPCRPTAPRGKRFRPGQPTRIEHPKSIIRDSSGGEPGAPKWDAESI